MDEFQASICKRFAPLLAVTDDPTYIGTLVEDLKTAELAVAEQTLGKARRKHKRWMTKHILDLCDTRRNLKHFRKHAN